MKMNICMLAVFRYAPKMRIVPQIGIASYLTNFGHDVTWILTSEKIKRSQETTFNGIQVFAVPCRHNVRFLIVITMALYAFRRMRFVFTIFRQEAYNMIFVRDSVLDGFLALYIKWRYKIPFVFELSNPLEQEWEYYKIGQMKPRFLYYLLAMFDRFMRIHIMRNADLILPTTHWFEDELVKEGIPSTKLMPFPNGVDMVAFSNVDGGELIREKYCLNNFKIIIYIGTMNRERHLDILLKAFSKVLERNRKVKLLMVGKGTDSDNLKKFTRNMGLENDIIFTGQVLQSEIAKFITVADIAVSPVPPTSFYRVSSPIKMLEYMALGKPVVANEEIPEQKEVLEQSGGGILVKFKVESFAKGIIKLLNNPEEAKDMGERGREWVMRNRTYEILARRLEERYFLFLRGGPTNR